MSIDCPLQPNGEVKQVGSLFFTPLDNFVKSFQFSPDGSLCLTGDERANAYVTQVDQTTVSKYRYYNLGSDSNSDASNHSALSAVHTTIPIGEAIYDMKWHPASDATNCCFASTSRDHPIILWDVDNTSNAANVRCTYRGYDHNDELDSAISMSFNLSGDKLYAGSNRMIRCFDVISPGKDCFAIPTSATRKSAYGQKGLISTIAFNPDYSGAYAAGSFAESVGIYVENTSECALLLNNLGFGVTHVRWSPCGKYLWTGGRNNNTILCWDIRSTQSIVGSVERQLNSNQRMTFDIDPWGKYLCTGTQDGKVLFFDTNTFELSRTIETNDILNVDNKIKKTSQSMCVNSVSFHPFSALLGVAIGERSFAMNADGNTDSESEAEVMETCTIPRIEIMHDMEIVQDEKRRKVVETVVANTNLTCSSKNNNNNNNNNNSGENTVTCGSSIQLWQLSYIPIEMPTTTLVKTEEMLTMKEEDEVVVQSADGTVDIDASTGIPAVVMVTSADETEETAELQCQNKES